MSILNRRLLRLAAMVLAAVSTGTVLTAVPANADHSDCAYPAVCLWDVFPDPDRKLQYKDFGRQRLAVANAVDHVYNTRRDDTVRLYDVRSDPDAWICLPPGRRIDLASRGFHNRVDEIEIRNEHTCSP